MTLKITLKSRVMLKIKRTKDMSDAENFQGLTFLQYQTNFSVIKEKIPV